MISNLHDSLRVERKKNVMIEVLFKDKTFPKD